jgi:hypothetical protein
MTQKNPVATLRRLVPAAALALLAMGTPFPGSGGALISEAQARPPGAEQIGGTWVATWRNSHGETRKGLIVIDQRGTQLSARIESHGNVTATGTLQGQYFTLRGLRTGVPFTVAGRIQGKKMSGALSALFVERQFTAVRRKGR